MPIIDTLDGTKEVGIGNIHVRETTAEHLKLYIDFLDEQIGKKKHKPSYVVDRVLSFGFLKDKDFQDWLLKKHSPDHRPSIELKPRSNGDKPQKVQAVSVGEK